MMEQPRKTMRSLTANSDLKAVNQKWNHLFRDVLLIVPGGGVGGGRNLVKRSVMVVFSFRDVNQRFCSYWG